MWRIRASRAHAAVAAAAANAAAATAIPGRLPAAGSRLGGALSLEHVPGHLSAVLLCLQLQVPLFASSGQLNASSLERLLGHLAQHCAAPLNLLLAAFELGSCRHDRSLVMISEVYNLLLAARVGGAPAGQDKGLFNAGTMGALLRQSHCSTNLLLAPAAGGGGRCTQPNAPSSPTSINTPRAKRQQHNRT